MPLSGPLTPNSPHIQLFGFKENSGVQWGIRPFYKEGEFLRKKPPSRRVLDGGNKVITKIVVASISKPHKTYPQVVKEKRNAARICFNTRFFIVLYILAATCIVYCWTRLNARKCADLLIFVGVPNSVWLLSMWWGWLWDRANLVTNLSLCLTDSPSCSCNAGKDRVGGGEGGALCSWVDCSMLGAFLGAFWSRSFLANSEGAQFWLQQQICCRRLKVEQGSWGTSAQLSWVHFGHFFVMSQLYWIENYVV